MKRLVRVREQEGKVVVRFVNRECQDVIDFAFNDKASVYIVNLLSQKAIKALALFGTCRCFIDELFLDLEYLAIKLKSMEGEK